eukprot:c33613_g1_i1 orf=90-251(-)
MHGTTTSKVDALNILLPPSPMAMPKGTWNWISLDTDDTTLKTSTMQETQTSSA